MSQSNFDPQIHFRSMLEASAGLFAIISKDFVFQYVNSAYAGLWNLQPEEVVGRPVRSVLSAEAYENSLDYLVEAISGNTVQYEAQYSMDQRMVILDTKLVPFSSGTTPDTVEGFYLTATDVTGKRVSKQALSLILASAPSRICLVDRDYLVTYANRRFVEEYCQSPDAKGVCVADLVSEAMWQRAKPNIVLAFQGRFVRYRDDAGYAKQTGNEVIVYLVPDTGKDPTVVNGVYFLIFDEAELELGRSRLRRRERNVDLAVRGQLVGIWEVDPATEDWLLTEHIENLLGLEAGELKNSQALTFERIHPEDLVEVRRRRQLNEGSNEAYTNEFRMKNKAGEYHWFRTVSRWELDPNGNSIYLAGTITDIDELKSAELLAAEQVKHRDSFLSMLSHELRNPVAAIKYAMDVFQQSADLENELPAKYVHSLNIVSRQTKIIARLLKDLLNVSRIRHNQVLYESAELCLVKLIGEIVEASAQNCAVKEQELLLECELDSYFIRGDQIRLHQVFVNLLDNASKYSPCDTKIRLTCRVDEATGDFVAVVSDQGDGIKPESQASIFELFFQEDPTLDRTAGGLGVGLYLVKQIVEAHQGVVSVTSPGKYGGSDFEVRIPEHLNPEKETRQLKAPDAKPSLVLVEDNEDSRVALSMALVARGFEVQVFEDGETAALNIPNIRPDIALVDIGLPRMDGMSLVRELRSNDELKSTLFIALTGYGQNHERVAILDAGFDHHLVKPLDLDELLKAIAPKS